MSYTQNEVNKIISHSVSSEKMFDSLLGEKFNTPFNLHTVHVIGSSSRINTYTVYPRDVDDVPEDLELEDMAGGDVIQLSMEYNGMVVFLYKTLQEMGIMSGEGFFFNRTFCNKEDAEKYLSIVKEADIACEEYVGRY